MEVRSLERAEPFVTKDGSTIRELLGLPTSALVRNQSLAEATLGPGQATERHYHRESEEIYFLLEGGGLSEAEVPELLKSLDDDFLPGVDLGSGSLVFTVVVGRLVGNFEGMAEEK